MEAITCWTSTKKSLNRPSAIFIDKIDLIYENSIGGSILELICGKSIYIGENYTELKMDFENFREDKPRINLNTIVFDKYLISDITYMWCESDYGDKTNIRFTDGEEISINEKFGKLLYKWGFYKD